MIVDENRSRRRKISLIDLVNKKKILPSQALNQTEELLDEGKITASDYEEMAEYFESLIHIEQPEQLEEEVNSTEQIEENTNEEIEVAK